jgi:hypothetical protein
MATFPRPLCELRVLLGFQGLHHRSRRSRPGGRAPAGTERPRREKDAPACASVPESQRDADVPGNNET